MTDVSRSDEATSGRSARARNDARKKQAVGERLTPLLTRETYTFAQMRIERGGPRVFSAIRLPGWKQT
jgi:hypothetical protein